MIPDVMNELSVRESIALLLRELLRGPDPKGGFVLNPGDGGLLASLDALSSGDASARPDGHSSVAAHVDHLRYGFELLNRWANGEDPWGTADYAASWTRQRVNDEEWQSLRAALTREASVWLEASSRRTDWSSEALTNTISSVVHLAYHVGAIRQVQPAASGPKAKD